MMLNKACQHGIGYDEQSEYCYYLGCKFESRLINKLCPDCQIHQHQMGQFYRLNFFEQKISSTIYSFICKVEFKILNRKIQLNDLKKQIIYLKSLIENMLYIEQISESLMFKSLQISKLLQQVQSPIIDQEIKMFEQFIKKCHENTNFNQIQTTRKYSIIKTHSIDLEDLNFVALSPNERYLLVGTEAEVYLYDIKTNLNKYIYELQDHIKLGQFSNNSSQIIVVTYKRILTIDIYSNKVQQIRSRFKYNVKQMFIFTKFMYVAVNLEHNDSRLIKIDLKSKQQIYSFYLNIDDLVYMFKDQIIYYQCDYSFWSINNEMTRKSQLKINLKDYQIQQAIIVNKYQMLSVENQRQLILWKIDYQHNSLVIQNNVPFEARYSIIQIFKANPYYGYFYIILKDGLLIFDQNYKLIYGSRLDMSEIKFLTSDNTSQFNSENLIVTFKQDWICLLQRHNRN